MKARSERHGKVAPLRLSRRRERLEPTGNGQRADDDPLLGELLDALVGLKRGDFRVRLPARRSGLPGRIASAFNECVELIDVSTREVDRVSKAVGREGRVSERVILPEAVGSWATRITSVNALVDDLIRPMLEIARVIEAVAHGDLSQKVALSIEGRPVKGEYLRIGKAVNAMVGQLSSFGAEVSRVAREVGTDGKLGVQAEVKGVSGTWKDLTNNVNLMASNLTDQVRNIAQVATAVARGDLSQKITVDVRGEFLQLKNTINTMVDQLSLFADEVTRVAREVGTEGNLGGQAQVKGVSGTWKGLTDNVNLMASNLTSQVRDIAHVATAVARGDLSQKIRVDVKGELLELKNTINTMVDQLSLFADEVSRVAYEVGTEGNLGGQAEVKGVSGTWKDLTDNVNSMASNLTAQVRNIAQVATAVARGDLSQKVTVDVKGELLELKDTINTMVDQLSSFADEVSRVAYEVGTEGNLGGQAQVPGVGGTWKDLTTNVNSMASNLTTEVRAIAEVATAVTHGELTRTIDVEARGEVAELKDNINYMIRNLRETTQKSAEQDWLKTNLARISRTMQGQRDLRELSRLVMSEVTPLVSAQHGAFFMAGTRDGEVELRLIASYALPAGNTASTTFRLGEGLIGQAAVERKPIVVTDPPEGYIRMASGTGEGAPAAIVVLPVVFEEQVLAVIELASFHSFSQVSLSFLEQLVETVGVVLNGVIANTRTEELLAESQRLAQELQDQSIELQQGQERLRQTNVELEEKASQLEEQNRSIELKNWEIEIAKRGLEQKARQLATASKYKSEFLANMSHELRTPLNSLMVLAQLLASNPDGTLTPKQVEFADTIYEAGKDLLDLINDILDLSKVEAGRLDINPSEVAVAEVRESIEQGFGALAEQKGLSLEVAIGTDCPPTFVTDAQRLQQILNNLLSNALKFTSEGGVTIRIDRAPDGLAYSTPQLEEAGKALAFTVSDTGIGIAPDQLDTIFEAFRQAGGTTSRRLEGTGLGLSISREVSRLLGGEIRVESSVDEGSRFTLYLPQRYRPVEPVSRDVARPTPPDTELARAEPDVIDREGAEVPPVRDGGLAGAKVLIVDDDERSVFALTNALEAQGSTVLFAQTGREAVDLLYRNPETDLIVLDIMMPEMDGYETTRTIRGTPQFADLPIIALTARAMKGDREKTLAAGATDYISKPVEVGELLAKIRACLHG